jgi:hypothetical protein
VVDYRRHWCHLCDCYTMHDTSGHPFPAFLSPASRESILCDVSVRLAGAAKSLPPRESIELLRDIASFAANLAAGLEVDL